MKKIITLLIIIIFLNSCSRSMTPYQAAQKPQKCGRGSLR